MIILKVLINNRFPINFLLKIIKLKKLNKNKKKIKLMKIIYKIKEKNKEGIK